MYFFSLSKWPLWHNISALATGSFSFRFTNTNVYLSASLKSWPSFKSLSYTIHIEWSPTDRGKHRHADLLGSYCRTCKVVPVRVDQRTQAKTRGVYRCVIGKNETHCKSKYQITQAEAEVSYRINSESNKPHLLVKVLVPSASNFKNFPSHDWEEFARKCSIDRGRHNWVPHVQCLCSNGIKGTKSYKCIHKAILLCDMYSIITL